MLRFMFPSDSAEKALSRLFNRRQVVDLLQLFSALGTRSRMTVFRRLSLVGYLSSYSHAGRFYTLRSIPEFDADGLWVHGGVCFSRDGTLVKTLCRLVEKSAAGQFHRELEARVRLRVHNTLADLVARKSLGREPVEGEFLYVSPEAVRAGEQLARRRRLENDSAPVPAAGELAGSLLIEVLLEIIRGTGARIDAKEVSARLVARGVAVSQVQVEVLLSRYSVRKKTAPSPSRRSRR